MGICVVMFWLWLDYGLFVSMLSNCFNHLDKWSFIRVIVFLGKGEGRGCWWLSQLVLVVYGDFYDHLVVLVDGSEN